MKKVFLFLIPILLVAIACKDEKKKTPQESMEELSKLPSMQAEGSDFSVDVPNGWTTRDTTMNGINFYFLVAPPTSGSGNVTLNIIHEGMQNMSLDQYKQGTLTTMKQRAPGFQLKEESEVEAGDLKGFRMNYTMLVNGATVDMVNYTFPKNNVAYILTGATPAGGMSKYQPTFDAVAHSFKVKE